MLKLKLKQVLLAQGKKSPQAWLQENCSMTQSKAHNLVNNKQKSIAFEDLGKICRVLQCTPDELFWWENTKRTQIEEWHPCRVKLIEPDKAANWTVRIEGLNPDRVEALKQFMITLETEKRTETKVAYDEVKQREKEQQEKDLKVNELPADAIDTTVSEKPMD